jgi:hypothetical protein
MANPEHLARLKEDLKEFNKWREQNPEVYPDLIGADLNGQDLSGANLSRADFTRANLCLANPRACHLEDWSLEMPRSESVGTGVVLLESR